MNQAAALPASMTAWAVAAYGDPQAIRAVEQPVPVPAAGELLVRMATVGVNPADWKACAGFLPFLPADYLPLSPGFDGSGTVVARGDEDSPFAVGDRVVFMSGLPLGRGGTWADYALAPAAHAVRLPASIAFAEAATIPVAGISAREALDQGGVGAGQTVLVNGGAGGTGTWAIQIARAAGARVAATARAANHDLLRALGAECVIDYTAEDIAARLAAWAPGGVDLLLDTVGQGSLADPAALIRTGGRYVAIETMLPVEDLPDQAAFAARNITAIRASASFARLREHLSALVAAVADSTMVAPPLELLPAADAAEAMARLRGGHVRGKLVLALDPEQVRAARPAAAPAAPATPASLKTAAMTKDPS